jgi:outer membrane immunogenic protein
MRRFFGWTLASAIAVGFTGLGGAMAADMALKARPVASAGYNWSGCYLGINGGYGWGDNNAHLQPSSDPRSQAFWNPAFNAGAAPSNFGYTTEGGLVGGQVGCNYQTGKFVFGIEGDIDWADISGSRSVSTLVPGFVQGNFSSGQTLHWLGTVRGRVGVTPVDRLLLYVTGGVAFGDVGYNLNFAFPGSNDFHSISTSNTETGWTIGAGAEWAVGNNWSVKAEYLYVDLGNRSLVSIPTGRAANVASTLTETFENKYNIVRVGLNYKFN